MSILNHFFGLYEPIIWLFKRLCILLTSDGNVGIPFPGRGRDGIKRVSGLKPEDFQCALGSNEVEGFISVLISFTKIFILQSLQVQRN